jgi:hypothetical protein
MGKLNAGAMKSIFDLEHSENEEKWVTIGIDKNGYVIAGTNLTIVRHRMKNANIKGFKYEKRV